MSDAAGIAEVDKTVSCNTIFGHPRGLVILFLTEMWERFSYYGMRGLLIFYLTEHFLFTQERSSLIYGAYTALVYVMTIIGGTLADKYLGCRKAVTFGAILLVLGHFGMAFEGNGSKELLTYNGTDYEITLDARGGDGNLIITSELGTSFISFNDSATQMLIVDPAGVGLPTVIQVADYSRRTETEELYINGLYLSLALIITGVGFLKANISTIVGSLYGFGDIRRDSGFTIFYMGINLGAFLASIFCGYLGIVFGWKYGFGLAGIGMLSGLMIFLKYQDWLEGKAEPPDSEKLKEKVLGPINRENMCYLTGLGIISISMVLVMNAHLIEEAYVGILGIIVFVSMVVYAFVSCEKIERNRMLAAIYFILAQIPFWALFEQAGSSLNFFTGSLVNRTVLGATIPAPVFQSFNAMFIVFFAPLLAILWIKLSKHNLNPSSPVKFALGVFMAGLGFIALVAGMKVSGESGLTAIYFIVLIYWIHTIGELMVSPVGLSVVTKLAPSRAVGMTMGAWFLYSGLSNYLAGVIASTTGAETIGGQITDIVVTKANYISVYTQVGYIAIGISLFMLLISPLIKNLMQGAD
ncbi:MAG: peptide MFS transporter [Pseudohongiellaceae bacterium]